jgi:hypothetical protein
LSELCPSAAPRPDELGHRAKAHKAAIGISAGSVNGSKFREGRCQPPAQFARLVPNNMAHHPMRGPLVLECAGEWVTMRRALICLCFGVVALPVLGGMSAAAPASVKSIAYVEATKGVIVSTTPNAVSSYAREHGTLIAHGTATGAQSSASAPPPCSTGSVPVSGSVTRVANANGDNLYDSTSGTVCLLSSTPTANTYFESATDTFTGGTGRFAGATGGGPFTATATLFATPQGSQGPFTAHHSGTIQLSH